LRSTAAGGSAYSIPKRLLAQTPTLGRDLFEPAFALPDLTGKRELEDYRGKVTLVNFWASWCGPCREEFPHMRRRTRASPRSVHIAAISDDVDPGKMRAFVTEFPTAFSHFWSDARRKRYITTGLPYSVLLDKQSRIIERIFGFGRGTEFQRLREINREGNPC